MRSESLGHSILVSEEEYRVAMGTGTISVLSLW